MSFSGSIPGLGSSPGEGHGSPLQYSCLKNPMTEEPEGIQSMGCRVRSDWATNTHNDLLKLTKFHVHLCHQLYPDVGKIRGDANFPLGVSRIPIMCHSPFKYNPKENRFSDVFCLSYWGLFFSPPARETILLRYSPRVFQKMLQKNIQTNTPAFCPF